MKIEALNKILEAHLLWLRDEGGECANLRGANLWDANLECANLRGANLRDANLRGANLEDANLRDANLRGANLWDANLWDANLRDANLRGANLEDANLRGANLRDANLWSANLECANLRGANLECANLRDANLRGANLWSANLRGANLECANLWSANQPHFQIPQEGELTVYKACCGTVVKLLIPAAAKRTASLVGRKCRAEFVEVLEIMSGEKDAVSQHDKSVVYRVGEIVRPDKYNDDIRVECSHGIHFFLTREEAEEWL